MDPVVGGALIGAGASLFGNLFNAHSTSSANSTNINLAKNAMRYRIEDLRSAGMSPLLAGDSGASFSPVAAPQMDLGSLSKSAEIYMQAKKQKHEEDALDAQTAKAESDVALNETNQKLSEVNQEVASAQRDYVQAQTDALKAETDFKKIFGFGPIDPKSFAIFQGYKALSEATNSAGEPYFDSNKSVVSGLGSMLADFVDAHNPFTNKSNIEKAVKSGGKDSPKLNWFEKVSAERQAMKDAKKQAQDAWKKYK